MRNDVYVDLYGRIKPPKKEIRVLVAAIFKNGKCMSLQIMTNGIASFINVEL